MEYPTYTNLPGSPEAGNYNVYNMRNIPSLLNSYNESMTGDCQVLDMTSMGAFMFLSQNESKSSFGFESQEVDTKDNERLSLAYERLHCIPKLLLKEVARKIRILDISHNEFENLDFLSSFVRLNTLICDRNYLTSKTMLPFMPNLELLWMNNCKIKQLYPWIKHLQASCPNLKYFSMMGNAAVPSLINGADTMDYLQYRIFVINLFPELKYLDDKRVSRQERSEAQKLNNKTLMERLCFIEKIPSYLKTISEIFAVNIPTPPKIEEIPLKPRKKWFK